MKDDYIKRAAEIEQDLNLEEKLDDVRIDGYKLIAVNRRTYRRLLKARGHGITWSILLNQMLDSKKR